MDLTDEQWVIIQPLIPVSNHLSSVDPESNGLPLTNRSAGRSHILIKSLPSLPTAIVRKACKT